MYEPEACAQQTEHHKQHKIHNKVKTQKKLCKSLSLANTKTKQHTQRRSAHLNSAVHEVHAPANKFFTQRIDVVRPSFQCLFNTLHTFNLFRNFWRRPIECRQIRQNCNLANYEVKCKDMAVMSRQHILKSGSMYHFQGQSQMAKLSKKGLYSIHWSICRVVN